MRKFLAVVVLLSCSWGCTPQSAYIEADRATFDVLSPMLRGYIEGDDSLDEQQVERRGRLIDTWRIRLEQAEGAGSDDV